MLRITAVGAGAVDYLLRGSGCSDHEHAPQLDAVVWRSTHASPQRVSPFGHACELGIQIVTAQISPVAQARSQLPQTTA